MNKTIGVVLAGLAALAMAGTAAAQTVRVGLINTYSGPMASNGDQIEKAINLFMKSGQCKLPAGVKIEIIKRDDTGINPETAKRLAQELIVRDKVQILTGVVWTPNALAIAPLATEAKVPFIIMNAGTAMITTLSPFIARTSFTLWQSSYPMGTWAAKKFKTAYVAVSDFGPGHDAQQAFTESFTKAGGKVIGTVRMPPPTTDFAPFLQRVKDAKPDALFVFVPSGAGSAVMKQFAERGLDKAGIKLIGPGDVTDDDILNDMGDVALGAITSHHYSAAHNSPENKTFVEAFRKATNGMRPNFMAVGGWDGMHLIYQALARTGGKTDGEDLVNAMKDMRWMSPRGPISIDPATRDIVQNVYVRKVERVDGQLYNIEFATFEAVKDPAKAR